MSCRRVLSSTPVSMGFGQLVRQQGKETYKLKLHCKVKHFLMKPYSIHVRTGRYPANETLYPGNNFFLILFYLHAVQIHLANGVKLREA
jgi:hypothetical protein